MRVLVNACWSRPMLCEVTLSCAAVPSASGHRLPAGAANPIDNSLAETNATSSPPNTAPAGLPQACFAQFKDRSWRLRLAAVTVLSETKDADAPGLLFTGLQDEDELVRATAADGSGKLKPRDRAVVPALAAVLANKARSVRAAAAAALGQFGTASCPAVPALVTALKGQQWSVRKEAAWTLGRIGAKAQRAVAALNEALRDKEGGVQSAANVGIQEIAEVEARNVSSRVPKKEPSRVSESSRAKQVGGVGRPPRDERAPRTDLVSIPGPEPVPALSSRPDEKLLPLLAALKDLDWQFASEAADAFARLGPVARSSVTTLMETFIHGGAQHVRLEAARERIDSQWAESKAVRKTMLSLLTALQAGQWQVVAAGAVGPSPGAFPPDELREGHRTPTTNPERKELIVC